MHISSRHARILIYNSLGHIDSLILNLFFINDYGNLQKKEAFVQLLFLPAFIIQEVLIATDLFEYCLPPAIFLCPTQPVFLHHQWGTALLPQQRRCMPWCPPLISR